MGAKVGPPATTVGVGASVGRVGLSEPLRLHASSATSITSAAISTGGLWQRERKSLSFESMTHLDDQTLDTTIFDLQGSHYDIGYAIGQGSQPFTLPAWWPEPPPLAFAQACAREISALHPSLTDEIHGHADGQHQSYNEILRIICRQRLGGRSVSVPPEHGGC